MLSTTVLPLRFEGAAQSVWEAAIAAISRILELHQQLPYSVWAAAFTVAFAEADRPA